MTTGRATAGRAGWLFEVRADQPLTTAMLANAGLLAGPLAEVRLELARLSPAGRWHLAPATTAAVCPQLARAADRGRAVRTARAGLLDGRLCHWCARQFATPGLVLSGAEGAYYALARYLTAAQAWVTALEAMAPSADWLAWGRWTARTPFTEPCPVPELLASLPADQSWTGCRDAAQATWDHLRQRAHAAWEHARHAAGPPGYRALAASARAIVAASPCVQSESRLLDAATGHHLPPGAGAWAVASTAWLEAIATDADTAAAQAALVAAIEARYRDVPIRDVTALPDLVAADGDYGSLAEWAQAEHHALRQMLAAQWSQRLADALASVLAPGDNDDQWVLLRVAGWPITSDDDRDLAYLGAYPELARIPDPDCGYPCGRGHPSWIVILHVPCTAAIHAVLHDSTHLDITTGPQIPPTATPTRAQIRTLLRDDPDHPATRRNGAPP